jgi:hypothetical protein
MTEHKPQWHKHKHTHIQGVSIAFRAATQSPPCTRRCPKQTYVSSRSSRIHRCCICWTLSNWVAGRIDVRSCSMMRCVYAYAGMLSACMDRSMCVCMCRCQMCVCGLTVCVPVRVRVCAQCGCECGYVPRCGWGGSCVCHMHICTVTHGPDGGSSSLSFHESSTDRMWFESYCTAPRYTYSPRLRAPTLRPCLPPSLPSGLPFPISFSRTLSLIAWSTAILEREADIAGTVT